MIKNTFRQIVMDRSNLNTWSKLPEEITEQYPLIGYCKDDVLAHNGAPISSVIH